MFLNLRFSLLGTSFGVTLPNVTESETCTGLFPCPPCKLMTLDVSEPREKELRGSFCFLYLEV
jgi:hypothetical protein